MSSLEEILKTLSDQIGQLVTEQQATNETLKKINARSVILQQKSRVPSQSALPLLEMEEPRREQVTRREIIHIPNVRNSQAHSQRPVVHGTHPSYDHIQCKKLSVSAFLKCREEVAMNETTEKITAMVDPTVLKDLIVTSRTHLDDTNFFNLSRGELYDLRENDFAPDPGDWRLFMTTLNAHLTFVFDTENTTSLSFKLSYEALLAYSARFVNVCMVPSYRCTRAKDFPPCSNLSGGLEEAHVPKIPFDYRDCLLLLERDKWDTLAVFVADAMAIVEEHSVDALRARKLRRAFGGTDNYTHGTGPPDPADRLALLQKPLEQPERALRMSLLLRRPPSPADNPNTAHLHHLHRALYEKRVYIQSGRPRLHSPTL